MNDEKRLARTDEETRDQELAASDLDQAVGGFEPGVSTGQIDARPGMVGSNKPPREVFC